VNRPTPHFCIDKFQDALRKEKQAHGEPDEHNSRGVLLRLKQPARYGADPERIDAFRVAWVGVLFGSKEKDHRKLRFAAGELPGNVRQEDE
jgi:hypothetical protein